MFNLARREGKHCTSSSSAVTRPGFFEWTDHDAQSAALPDYARLPLALGVLHRDASWRAPVVAVEQVDFLKNTVTLYAGETKTGEGRTIPIVLDRDALGSIPPES